MKEGIIMDSQIITAIIAFAGTAVGTLGGILTSSKLTNFRLKQLEKKVDKHNNLIERMYILETQMKDVQKDIEELKRGG